MFVYGLPRSTFQNLWLGKNKIANYEKKKQFDFRQKKFDKIKGSWRNAYYTAFLQGSNNWLQILNYMSIDC